MEQNAAMIAAIVAIVLGAAGLVGGSLGYAQGAAAVRRATAARHRAAAAEEAALQAKAEAQAAVRDAEELLARLRPEPRRTTGPVRRASEPPSTAGSAPDVEPMSEPTTGALLLPESVEPAPDTSTDPQESSADAPTALLDVVDRPAFLRRRFQTTAPLTGPAATRGPEDAGRGERSGGRSSDAGPDTPDATSDLEPSDAEADAEPLGAPEPDVSERPTDDETGSAVEAGAGGDEQDADDDPAEVASTDPERPDDGTLDEDAAGPVDEPARPGRGQVTAGAQPAPTMDWAEVLRTGAIPLPSISRGTWAAPRARPKPTGEGPARFEARAVGRQRYEAVNVGGEPATDASLVGIGEDPHLVRPVETRPVTVGPGGTMQFAVLRVEGRSASVRITWTAAGDEVVQELPLD